jgi:ribosomal protein S18 acetylase RimI-like enzyme
MDADPAPLHERSAPEVVDAIRANWSELYRHLGQAPGVEVSEGQHLSWTLTRIPDPFLNVVFRTNLPADGPGPVIDDALAHFRAQGIRALSWLTPEPAAGAHLLERGLTFMEDGHGMAADLASLPEPAPRPPGVTIVAVEDRASFESWTHVMRIGFGTAESAEPDLVEVFAAIGSGPRMRTYLALLDGRPVATSQVFLGAGVAGIYQVTCLPEARGRGIGGAVTLASVLDARRSGYAVAILQASELGVPVYRRLGFHDYGRLPEYRFTGDPPEAQPGEVVA